MANSRKRSTPTWHELAQPSTAKRARWARGMDRNRWISCGKDWDAVAITPMDRGLAVLAALRVSPQRGALVLADHLRGTLYVMVAPGSGGVLAGLPEVRVLSGGSELLMPATYDDSTAVADLISYPRGGASPALIPADRLAQGLRGLPVDVPKEVPVS
ncbi:hypothetical protein [Streptomyces tauricus]|uniref:hypothetical protein n=1 Tax=Streptomyces tauricus TaxID=68274 RepID=UPI001671FAEB|nr:hypothetical protein [Streptomyces tauricus]